MNDDDPVFGNAKEENREWNRQCAESNRAARQYHETLIAEGLKGIEAYRNRIDYALLNGLERYLEQRIATGDFLRAVLENNLFEAVGRMHPSLHADTLRFLVELLQNYFPASSFGSPEAVTTWLERDW